MKKLKIIMGYDSADVPTRYFIGKTEITKLDFAKEVLRRSEKK